MYIRRRHIFINICNIFTCIICYYIRCPCNSKGERVQEEEFAKHHNHNKDLWPTNSRDVMKRNCPIFNHQSNLHYPHTLQPQKKYEFPALNSSSNPDVSAFESPAQMGQHPWALGQLASSFSGSLGGGSATVGAGSGPVGASDS